MGIISVIFLIYALYVQMVGPILGFVAFVVVLFCGLIASKYLDYLGNVKALDTIADLYKTSQLSKLEHLKHQDKHVDEPNPKPKYM